MVSLVLAVALAVVDAGALVYIIAIEPTYHTWLAVGDVDAAAALLVLGVVVFPAATVLACRLERITAVRIADHVRQCAILYIVVGVFLLLQWPARHTDGGSLGFAMTAIGAAGALVGIVFNALTIAWLGSRERRARGCR